MENNGFKICKSCGAQIPVNAKFCLKCGMECIDENKDISKVTINEPITSDMEEKQSNDNKKDSQDKKLKRNKPIKWWYSMPIILICGFFGVISIPLILIAIILLIIRLIKTKGISVFQTIKNVLLIIITVVFTLSAFSEDTNSNIENFSDSANYISINESQNESIISESDDSFGIEETAENEPQTESIVSEANDVSNIEETSEANKDIETEKRNLLFNEDLPYIKDAKKYMTEWKYPDKFNREREDVFSFIKKAQDLGVSGYGDEYSILVKESSAFDHSLQRTLDKNPDAVTFYYYGDLKNEKPDGMGILFFNIGGMYAGNFKNGEPHGYGILYSSGVGIYCESENFEYAGDHEFRANGESIVYYTDYEKGNNRTPRGEASYIYNTNEDYQEEYTYIPTNYTDPMCLPPAVAYEGEMKNNKREGDGKTYYDVFQFTNGRDVAWLIGDCYGPIEYVGDYDNDKFSGDGTLYFYTGQIKYDGKLKNGVPDGKGTLYDENGNIVYKGKFKKGDIE